MKHLPEKLASICLLLTAGSACAGTGERTAFEPSQWTPVSNEKLGKMRGGYDAGPGLNVSFGIVKSVTINGDLVSKTSFDLPDVTKISAEQASLVRAAISEATVIQNGVGNFVDVGIRSELAAGTVIQNSLNNQHIQTLTVINTSVNSLALLKAINIQTALNDALVGSMRIF